MDKNVGHKVSLNRLQKAVNYIKDTETGNETILKSKLVQGEAILHVVKKIFLEIRILIKSLK